MKQPIVTFGIQGGKGSFNEQALQVYITKNNITDYTIDYLYRSEAVLQALEENKIDYGIFAIANTLGGVVDESIYAMAKYRFAIIDDFQMQICHYLMKKKDVATTDITTIMAHPQVFKQCRQTLEKKYPHFTLKTGTGDAIDTAKAAEQLSLGKLPKSVAILGPKALSMHYDFEIIAENLQDSQDNYTRFLVVTKQV